MAPEHHSAEAASSTLLPTLLVGTGDTFIYERRLVRMLGYDFSRIVDAGNGRGRTVVHILFEPVFGVRQPRDGKAVMQFKKTLREMNRLPLCWPYEFKPPTFREYPRP